MQRVFYKLLTTNDNSKNQPYLGSGWDIVNILPLGNIAEYPGSVSPNFKCSIEFYWLNNRGEICRAPHSKLILYKKYPEVRFSGFIMGCSDRKRLSRLMNPDRSATLNRVMIFGITGKNSIIGYVRESNDNLINSLVQLESDKFGALTEISIDNDLASLEQLKIEIKNIIHRGWCKCRYLKIKNGDLIPEYYRSIRGINNIAGMTLEAELGIPHNPRTGPDWKGWEFKVKKVPKKINYIIVSLFRYLPQPQIMDYISITMKYLWLIMRIIIKGKTEKILLNPINMIK